MNTFGKVYSWNVVGRPCLKSHLLATLLVISKNINEHSFTWNLLGVKVSHIPRNIPPCLEKIYKISSKMNFYHPNTDIPRWNEYGLNAASLFSRLRYIEISLGFFIHFDYKYECTFTKILPKVNTGQVYLHWIWGKVSMWLNHRNDTDILIWSCIRMNLWRKTNCVKVKILWRRRRLLNNTVIVS